MGRDIGAGFEKYFKGDNVVDAWVQLVKEFAGSMILILVASGAGLANGFNWAVSYVVLSILFEGHHFNSFVTFYRAFTGSMCCVQGLFFLGAQFLGGYVAGHLGGALGVDADSVSSFEINDIKNGVQTAIAVCLFLWTFNHACTGKVGDHMSKGIFMIASIAVVFMFQADFVFSYHRCFQSMDTVKASGAVALWGAVACIVTHVKSKLMGVEDKWFWESDCEEAGAPEEKEPVVESEA
jgi:hypothetical protein